MVLFEPRKVSDIHSTRVLSLDSNGRILDWISWQDAVCLYVRDAVSWNVARYSRANSPMWWKPLARAHAVTVIASDPLISCARADHSCLSRR